MKNSELRIKLLDGCALVQDLISQKSGDGDLIAAVMDIENAVRNHDWEPAQITVMNPTPMGEDIQPGGQLINLKPAEQLNGTDKVIEEGEKSEAPKEPAAS